MGQGGSKEGCGEEIPKSYSTVLFVRLLAPSLCVRSSLPSPHTHTGPTEQDGHMDLSQVRTLRQPALKAAT